MPKHPKKPLSPYDPRSKMSDKSDKKPFIPSETKPANESRFQIRGCGDPQCDVCNTHIPYEVARTMRPVPSDGISTASRNFPAGDFAVETTRPAITATEIMNNMVSPSRRADEMRREFERVMFGAYTDPNSPFAQGTGNSRAPSVPASLIKAREAVQKYILAKDHNVTWDSVIGNDTAKTALRDAIEAQITERDLYEHYGMTSPKGVLLWGPPGCGKTMFAKASATAMKAIYGKDVEVLAIGGAEIQSPYIAVTEGIISSLFLYAREYKAFHGHPLVMFIDECETLLPDRTGKERRVAPWEQSQVAVFLDELDGMKELGAFVILATNQPDKIDEALLRDGRIDRKIKIERPSRKAIEHIIYNGLTGIPLMTSQETLAFTAVEALCDPAYVLKEGHVLLGNYDQDGTPQLRRDIAINFCLEHIVSGAMAASVATRAKALAFSRDRAERTRTGISIPDVIGAVRQIFEENKDLEHSFALNEFIANIPMKELQEPKRRLQ